MKNAFKPLSFKPHTLDENIITPEFTIQPNDFGLYNISHISKIFYSAIAVDLGYIIRPSNWKIKDKVNIQAELSRNDDDYNDMFVYSESGYTTCVNNYLAKKYFEWAAKEVTEWLKENPRNCVVEPEIDITLEDKIEQVKIKMNQLMDEYIKLRIEYEKNPSTQCPTSDVKKEIFTEHVKENYYAIGHYWNSIKGQDNKLTRDARLRCGRKASSLAEIEGWIVEQKIDRYDNKYYVYPESKLKANFDRIYGDIKKEDLEKNTH